MSERKAGIRDIEKNCFKNNIFHRASKQYKMCTSMQTEMLPLKSVFHFFDIG